MTADDWVLTVCGVVFLVCVIVAALDRPDRQQRPGHDQRPGTAHRRQIAAMERQFDRSQQ